MSSNEYRRHKISQDPNNTKWSRNITTFGHRILSSQGWTPGQTLGREKALHARHFTTASASHVRIALRQDNLGLGAKPGSGQGPGECTGLDSFQDLLGRLNGKTEDIVVKERDGRAHVKRSLYAESKYGGWSKFISAGYLVGDESMQNQLDTKTSIIRNGTATESDEVIAIAQRTKSQDCKEARKEKKPRKSGSSKGEVAPMAADQVVRDNELAKVRRKAEKAARRAEKAQKKKEVKTVQRITEDSISSAVDGVSYTSTTEIIQPSSTDRGFTGGRHAIRARYIMQKKAAILDAKALNEILMVKG